MNIYRCSYTWAKIWALAPSMLLLLLFAMNERASRRAFYTSATYTVYTMYACPQTLVNGTLIRAHSRTQTSPHARQFICVEHEKNGNKIYNNGQQEPPSQPPATRSKHTLTRSLTTSNVAIARSRVSLSHLRRANTIFSHSQNGYKFLHFTLICI